MISRWPVRTGVLVDGETAYFGAGVFPHEMVYLCAVNAKDGTVIWRNDTISEQDAGRNDLSPQGYMLCNETTSVCPFGAIVAGRRFPNAPATSSFKNSTRGGPMPVASSAAPRRCWATARFTPAVRITFLAMDQQTGNVGEAWINGRQMVLAGPFAYIMTAKRSCASIETNMPRRARRNKNGFSRHAIFAANPKNLPKRSAR